MQLPEAVINNLKTSCKEMEKFKTKLFENDDQVKYIHEIMALMGLVGQVESIVEISEAEKLNA